MISLLPEIAWVIAKISSNQILFSKTDKFHWKTFMGNLSLFLSPFSLLAECVTASEHAGIYCEAVAVYREHPAAPSACKGSFPLSKSQSSKSPFQSEVNGARHFTTPLTPQPLSPYKQEPNFYFKPWKGH